MTCLCLTKITGEPKGAPWIFGNHIQAKHLHSSSGTNPPTGIESNQRTGEGFIPRSGRERGMKRED